MKRVDHAEIEKAVKAYSAKKRKEQARSKQPTKRVGRPRKVVAKVTDNKVICDNPLFMCQVAEFFESPIPCWDCGFCSNKESVRKQAIVAQFECFTKFATGLMARMIAPEYVICRKFEDGTYKEWNGVPGGWVDNEYASENETPPPT
jgi:hypothetical protein